MLKLHYALAKWINRSSHRRCSVKKSYSWKFSKCHRKTAVLEPPFKKVLEKVPSLLTRDSNTGVFLLNLWNFLRWEYTVKYFFQSISWKMYFTLISLCKLPTNIHDVIFEGFHEIWKFWKSIFRIFSIVKDFPIEFVFMLD